MECRMGREAITFKLTRGQGGWWAWVVGGGRWRRAGWAGRRAGGPTGLSGQPTAARYRLGFSYRQGHAGWQISL